VGISDAAHSPQNATAKIFLGEREKPVTTYTRITLVLESSTPHPKKQQNL
jgi:hypothetical protein